MPLIGSVNAVTPGVCTEYARRLAETGINGLELNLYDVAADLDQTGEQVEQRLLETFESVRDAVDIPVAVKLSPYFASVGNIVKELDERGARGVVLFNRFIQPDIDIETEKLSLQMPMSSREEIRLPLRWVTLVYAKVGVDLCGTTGIQSAEDIIKFILGGATTVQTASHLYRNGIESISVLIQDLKKWMDEHGYSMIEDFRGKVSQLGLPGNARRFERAQYMKIIDSYTG
jgi:dihydroorotate dehydrogenase (fumarate)